MYGGDRRKTGGFGFGNPRTSAITPTKRFTDLGTTSSVRKDHGRLSMSQTSGHHRVSLFGGASATGPKDVRANFDANAKKIYNFLVEHEGSEAPSENVIRCPAGKSDFVTVFELMYQHLSKDYEFPQNVRVEEEIPKIFKALGYAPPLKNSYFQPMGSAMGYPHLVEALAWLVDLIRINASVSADTQPIIFGDVMDQEKVHEKTLSYAWMSTTFRDYTNDRKAAESGTGPFWEETKSKLRDYFEKSDEIEDVATNYKSALEQLRFECEEIEAERGNELTLLEEIAKIKDDVRKALEYDETTARVQKHKEDELKAVKGTLEQKMAENSKVQAEVAELKERIEVQKQMHGLTGKEVRQLNSDNNRDKETVTELQAELDEISKQMWRLKNEDTFKQQKTNFVRLVESVEKIVSGLDIEMGLEPLRAPSNENELKSRWDELNSVWIPEINRQLHQKKLEFETEQSRFADRFAAAEERVQMERELLCEAKKKEAREDRVRRNERDEWKENRLQREKKYDELENEKDVLTKKMQMDGTLDKEMEEERTKAWKLEQELQKEADAVENAIRKNLDLIVNEVAQIENDKMLFHVECCEFEKLIVKTQNMF